MAWNVFRFCTALRGLGFVMVLLVLGVVGVTYYAVVVTDYGPALFHGGFSDCLVALGVLILFHALLMMLLWSYFSVVLTDPGGVPPNWKPIVDEEGGETCAMYASEFCQLQSGPGDKRIRYCRKCNHFKPPRSHHCSICGRCVLKMDHHCIWVVNCVGALNYKSFLLFLNFDSLVLVEEIPLPVAPSSGNFLMYIFSSILFILLAACVGAKDISKSFDNSVSFLRFYTFLETSLVTLSLLPNFLVFFTDQEIHINPGGLAVTFIAFVLDLAFALSILGFLIMHISLVAGNTTTIEAYEKKTSPKWCYDLGRRKNFEQVFGTDKLYWFIPAYSEEDKKRMPLLQGLEYPLRPDFETDGL